MDRRSYTWFYGDVRRGRRNPDAVVGPDLNATGYRFCLSSRLRDLHHERNNPVKKNTIIRNRVIISSPFART
jgi:hypothetical protein